jgi:PKD repeat protein
VRIAPAFRPGPGIRALGAVPASAPMTVAVGFAPTDPQGLEARTLLEYTPASPEYARYLTPSELTSRYGPPSTAYDAAQAYFAGYGLVTTTSPDRLLLVVSGPSDRVAAAFRTSFALYSDGARVFYSHPTPAELPAIAPWTGAVGLGNESAPRPSAQGLGFPGLRSTGVPGVAGCTGGAVYPLIPCEVQTAYNETGLLSGGNNGSGFSVGVVDAYDSAEPQTTLARDFSHFTTNFSLPSGGVHFVYPVPTSVDLNRTPSSGWGVEEALDLEWARALAPGDSIDMTLAPDAFAGLYASVDWLVAHRAVDSISLSWGEPDTGVYNAYAGACASACNATSDGSYSLLHPVLVAAAAEGIGVFAATGDCGAADGTSGVATNFPASDPFVTAVGATDLTIGSGGAYVSETGWTGNSTGARAPGCQNQGGSGGGYSPFPRPAWQSGHGIPSSIYGRAIPDVSLVGATASPVVIYCSGPTGCSGLVAVAGTSASSPMWAGLSVVWDQKTGRGLGFLSPSLYSILRSAAYAADFHDVTSGWNGYTAGPGWDPVTGIGTPDAGAIVADLASPIFAPSSLQADLRATPRYGVAPLTVAFNTSTTGGTPPYPLLDLDFGDGNATLVPSNASVSHTYTAAGAYSASLVAFDSAGASVVSPPLAVDVGGGALSVHLTASASNASVGASVTFSASASGGTGPYTYSYAFGDGTYLPNSGSASVSHAFGAAGGFCAAVFVEDAATPPAAATSNRVGVTVGGASPLACANPPALVASASSAILAMDSAADLPLRVSASGGFAPISTRILSDDAYASACQCPILRTPGPHSLDVIVSDSYNQQTEIPLSVTVYPALAATFAASTQIGSAPLAVAFSASPSGGHGTDVVSWNFGDGSTATGISSRHVYSSPGFYLAVGSVEDRGNGNASEAFLIDVRPSGATGLGLTATVDPAVRAQAGAPVAFAATVTGGAGPYLIRWSLGPNASAFGASVNETFPDAGCLGAGTCPLNVRVDANDAAGRAVNASFALAPAISHRFSALSFFDNVSASGGPTPFRLSASANATGVPGAAIAWDFGDGATATASPVTHVYLRPGNFTLTEFATDIAGDRLIVTHALAITGVARSAPSLLGGPNASAGIVPFAVQFNVSGSGGAGPLYSFSWDFGDGSTGSGSSPLHVYVSPGHFVATATVTDALGDTGTRQFPISAYTATDVGLVGPSPPLSTTAGGSLPLAVHVRALCTTESVPGCGDNAVRVTGAWLPVDGAPAPGLGSLPTLGANAAGWANGSLPAPLFPGRYELRLSAIGPAYRGSELLPVTVGPAVGLLGLALSPLVVLGAGVAVGVAVWATTFHRSRGPRPVRIPRPPPVRVSIPGPVSPSPRPAGPDAPPDE